MSTAGQQLFSQISAGLWSALQRYRSQAAAKLESLGPEPGFPDPRLLTALHPDDIVAQDPGVAALIQGLRQVLPSLAPGAPLTLHGFAPDPGQPAVLAMVTDRSPTAAALIRGLQQVLPKLVPSAVTGMLRSVLPGTNQPRGLALVIVIPPAVTLVVSLTSGGPTGIALEFAAFGSGAFGPATLNLAQGWSLLVSGDLKGGGHLQFPRGGPAASVNGQQPLSVQLTLQYDGTPISLGAAGGPQVALTNLSVGVQTATGADGSPKISWAVALPKARLSLISDGFSALLGDTLSIPVDLSFTADPELGFALKGGGLSATLPANLSLPGVNVGAVDLNVLPSGGDVRFSFGIGFTATLPGFPLLSIAASGLGASFPLSTGAASTNLGLNAVAVPPDPAAVRPNRPSGLGLDLALPLISGGGFLQTTGSGGYGGILELNLSTVAIKAFGLLQLPFKEKPLSFVAVISLEFPPPGIDLSFGFALAGVGGIVAINRRLDTDALEAAVVDGSATRLLFPVSAAAHAPSIVATLGRVFPEAKDHIVVGPMLKISWGGRIVSGVIAVVADFPNPLQFVFLGRIIVALPDPLAPLVFVQAVFVGAFELSPTPSVSILASLDGSNIAGIPLNGDIFFLLRGGDDADFVFSAGGFHPRYVPPKNLPPMQRLQLAMTPPGVPGVRAEAYFAVTTNSVQFGAKLELCDEIAGCGVDGWFAFDALFKWDPVFSFSIRASAGVAVQVIGETLMGVAFDLLLEGPAPWHIQGTGHIRLFLFHASLDFEATWGPAPAALGIAPDLGDVLRTALASPSAWTASPPNADTPMVSLSAAARNLLSAGVRIHPLGSVTVRQRAVPFNIMISRFQQKPIPPQTWSIVAPEAALTRDSFPPGELLDLTEDEKLSWPAFERWYSGAALEPTGELHSELRTWDTDYETSLVPDFRVIPGQGLSRLAFANEVFLAVGDVHQATNLWHPPNREVVSVLAAHPVTVATTDTLREPSGFISPGGFTETVQAARAQFGTLGHAAPNQIVESWEIIRE
jgi:hypothetical protein